MMMLLMNKNKIIYFLCQISCMMGQCERVVGWLKDVCYDCRVDVDDDGGGGSGGGVDDGVHILEFVIG